MIPLLFPADETAYAFHGIGPISDATSCTVAEELNGEYTLSMTVPRSSPHLADLAVGRQIFIKPNPYDQAQPFRIQRVNKRLRGEIEIYAPHICYDLSRRIVQLSSSQTFNTVGAAFDYVNNNIGLPLVPAFTFATELSTSMPASIKLEAPVYAWDLLAEGENTLQSPVPGEWYFDRYSVLQKSHRGAARGYVIAYGLNMTELTHEAEGENFYTGYLPFWGSGSDMRVGTLVQSAIDLQTYGYSRVLLADMKDYFSTKPSLSALDSYAATIYADGIGKLQVSIKVSAVPPGSRGLKTIEEMQLGDTITVRHEPLGIDIQTRVVSTTFDALKERYTSVEVSNAIVGAARMLAPLFKGR